MNVFALKTLRSSRVVFTSIVLLITSSLYTGCGSDTSSTTNNPTQPDVADMSMSPDMPTGW